MKDISNRIKIAKKNKFGSETNCMGTALYLVELTQKDSHINPTKGFNRYISQLDEIENPSEGDLITLESEHYIEGVESILHIGVIVNLNPLKITHRTAIYDYVNEENSPFREKDILDVFMEPYLKLNPTVRYYRVTQKP